MKTPIFYFRGLNTANDDGLHLGPVVRGTMYGALEHAFSTVGVTFIPVQGMGTASVDVVVQRAKTFIVKHPAWLSSDRCHFFGHSTGALIARALAHDKEIQPKVLSHLSLGAPHRGCLAADHALEVPKIRPWLTRVFGLFWDYQSRLHLYSDLSTATVARFNEQFPNLPSVQYASIVCEITRPEMCWALFPLYFMNHFHPSGVWRAHASDGLIGCTSQEWGEVLGQCRLDHITQLGHFYFFRSRLRAQHRSEFSKMLKIASDYWRRFN